MNQRQMKHSRACEGQAGFTLLEVLVAFTICAFMLGGFLQVFSNGLKQDRTTDRYATALLHAESLLAQVGKITPLRIGEEAGRTADGFSWRILQTLYGEAGSSFEQTPLIPYQVTLTMTWAVGETERALSITSLRLANRF